MASGLVILVLGLTLCCARGQVPAPVTPPGPPPIAAGTIKVNPKDGAEMVYIPAGDFQMGDSDIADNPRHAVTVTGYWIYKDLVTVAQYRNYCHLTKHKFPPAPPWGWRDDNPIVNVTWVDASAYAEWARATLPTEAQFEKAARGTDGRKYPWGDQFDSSQLWCSATNPGGLSTTAVGRYAVSPFGATDMVGNVWEWCADWYDKNFWTSSVARGIDPRNDSAGTQQERVRRGGSFLNVTDAGLFRSSLRLSRNPNYIVEDDGFRCVAAFTPN